MNSGSAVQAVDTAASFPASFNPVSAWPIPTGPRFGLIVGKSSALRDVLNMVTVVAPTDATVMIQGETGTGKELIARALHYSSQRSGGSFVKLNCAAIPATSLESELFGHEKGAFTGAFSQRLGRFELAHRGTLFLDEVGEIPLELQAKLLRVLQEREFERLGSARTQRTDVRVIAATNRDLRAMVRDRQFREDLFCRLNVFPIELPPLRERRDDIPLLVRHFADHFARRMNKVAQTIPSDVMRDLTSHEWPGNIRELQNMIERAVILSPGPVLQLRLPQVSAGRAHAGELRLTLQEVKRRYIIRTLEATDRVVSGPNGAAEILGLRRTTLQSAMAKLGIHKPTAPALRVV